MKVKLKGNYKSHKSGEIIDVQAGEIAYLKGMGLYSEYKEPVHHTEKKEAKPRLTKQDKPDKSTIRPSK